MGKRVGRKFMGGEGMMYLQYFGGRRKGGEGRAVMESKMLAKEIFG